MARKFEVSGGSQKSLRSLNQNRILDALTNEGEMTQAQIARKTSLAASTVSNIVNELIELGLVERKENLGGPHGQLIGIVPDEGLVVGVDVGHRHLTLAVSNLAHEILAETRVNIERGHVYGDTAPRISKLIDQLIEEIDGDRDDVRAIGVAIPAPIDTEMRRISSAQVMLGWAGIDLPAALSKDLGAPVFVENDANLGAIGERIWGAAQGVDNLAYIKVADGIGAGLIVDGRLYRGADGSAGEIGHSTIDERGKMCRCGNRGCLETFGSVSSILELARPIFGDDLKISDLIQHAQNGHTGAVRILEDTARSLGIALANLVNTLNPRMLVLGGIMAEAGDLMIEPIRSVLNRYAVHGVVKDLEFRRSELGIRSHVLGAVSLALDNSKRV